MGHGLAASDRPDYKALARSIRRDVLGMIHLAQTSHIGSCFSATDLLCALFERLDFKSDEFIASKGWCAALVYALLARHGLIPKEDLERFCRPGEKKYIGLVEPRGVFGMRFAGGSMCYGVSAGCGFALSRRWRRQPGRVWVLESDGGMNGGTTWEAAAFGAHHKLDNLTVIVDVNRYQAMGRTEDILKMEPLERKWRAFGWAVRRADGHDFRQIEEAYGWAEAAGRGKPTVILADTVKGKGVRQFEREGNKWHYWHVDKATYKKALAELRD